MRRQLRTRDGGTEPGNHVSLAVDQELGKVPLDVVTGPGLAQGGKQFRELFRFGIADFVQLEAAKIDIERVRLVAVDIDLGKLGIFCAEIYRAELGDLFVCAGRLFQKLIAWKVQNGKAPLGILLMQPLQVCILRRKAAASRGIDNQQNLALIVAKGNVFCFLSRTVKS